MSIFDNVTITILIVVFTGLVSFQGFNNYHLIDRMKHFPYRESSQKEWYRMFTSGFVHADWIHLLVNMYVLYSFGEFIESVISSWYGSTSGRLIFFLVYVLNIILANIPTMLKERNNPGFSSIGASGAISGMLFMSILLNPWAMFQLFFIIPIPAVLLGVGYLIYSSISAKKGQGRLDHSAHFAGAIAGMVLLIAIHPEIVGEFFRKLVTDFPIR